MSVPNILSNDRNNKNKYDKKMLIFALYFDMVHDFLEGGGIVSDFEKDKEILLKLYTEIFGNENVKKISLFLEKYKRLSVMRLLEEAHEYIYRNKNNEGNFFTYDPRNDGSYETKQIQRLSDLYKLSWPLIDKDILYDILSRRNNSSIQNILIIENAQKSARAIPALYNLVVGTQKGSYVYKRVTPINSLPRKYNQAQQKFPIQNRNLKKFQYKIGGLNIKMSYLDKNEGNKLFYKYLQMCLDTSIINSKNATGIHTYFFIQENNTNMVNSIIKVLNDGGSEQKFIEFMRNETAYFNPIQKGDNTVTKCLNALFPIGKSSTRYRMFEIFKENEENNFQSGAINTKTTKILTINHATQLFMNNSLKIVASAFTNMNRRYFVRDLIREIVNQQSATKSKVSAATILSYDGVEHIETIPSVSNVVLTARNFLIEYVKNSKVSQMKAKVAKAAKDQNRSPVLDDSTSKALINRFSKLNRQGKIKLFLILFSKTCGDLNQIIYTKYHIKEKGYFLTFDKLAALIALLLNCNVIFTGESSKLNSNMNGEHSQTYNKKVGFSVIGPHKLILNSNTSNKVYNNVGNVMSMLNNRISFPNVLKNTTKSQNILTTLKNINKSRTYKKEFNEQLGLFNTKSVMNSLKELKQKYPNTPNLFNTANAMNLN